MNAGKVLVVDDEPDIRSLVKEILEDEGFSVDVAENGEQAKNIKSRMDPDLILLDIWMPDIDGITLLKEWTTNESLNFPVVMMSGHGTVETAVEATRLGAYDFIEKPLSLAKLLLTVRHALENTSLQKENILLKQHNRFEAIPVGKSELIRKLREQIQRIANHKTPVLIRGESGTDKELYARYLHSESDRSEGPFISVSISSLSDSNSLLELFGSEEDDRVQIGFMEKAMGGTLFLKDIADMDLPLQSKLQNALEETRIIRQGSTEAVPIDIRVVAASSEDIESLVKSGKFRDDLFYQLSVVPVTIPPLSEHSEDIPELLEFYISHFVEVEGLPYRRFSVAAQNRLRRHDWPGNVRELKNLVQRLLILSSHEVIEVSEVESHLGKSAAADGPLDYPGFDMPIRDAREQFEKAYFEHHLQENNGSVSKVAIAAGMERTHLYRKLKSLGIDIKT
ncbi:MAG: sigma-54 dependent transcriptional regulator [Thiotrichales bacterium]|nr:sigma-54 dependent transcriptional regulator [Thiotrichales bacterium]